MRVGLFVSCLVDLHRPSVGVSVVKLLRNAGFDIVVPKQTCCGQIAYNGGDFDTASALALQFFHAFCDVDCIVVPSSSCAGMLQHHLSACISDPKLKRACDALSQRIYDLGAFLHEYGTPSIFAPCGEAVAYHASCSALRETCSSPHYVALLRQVPDLALRRIENEESCCGFGGTFCVKYPDISTHMVDQKIEAIIASGATTLTSADLGCLMNLEGRLRKRGYDIKVRHVAEIFAGIDPDMTPDALQSVLTDTLAASPSASSSAQKDGAS